MKNRMKECLWDAEQFGRFSYHVQFDVPSAVVGTCTKLILKFYSRGSKPHRTEQSRRLTPPPPAPMTSGTSYIHWAFFDSPVSHFLAKKINDKMQPKWTVSKYTKSRSLVCKNSWYLQKQIKKTFREGFLCACLCV